MEAERRHRPVPGQRRRQHAGRLAQHRHGSALPDGRHAAGGGDAPAANPSGSVGGAAGLVAVTGYDADTGAISPSFDPACDSTVHTVHYGSLAQVSSYEWAGADCGLDASGSGSLIPDPAAGDAIFFVVVGHNGDWEGGYGESSHHEARPANTLAADACLRQASARNFCE